MAHRLGGHHVLYYATLDAVDVALDRGDLGTARDLLPDLDRHATAQDTDTASTTRTDEVAERRKRLADLDEAPRHPV